MRENILSVLFRRLVPYNAYPIQARKRPTNMVKNEGAAAASSASPPVFTLRVRRGVSSPLFVSLSLPAFQIFSPPPRRGVVKRLVCVCTCSAFFTQGFC